MQNSVVKNNALDFDDEQWSQLINANGLLIMWFIEWNKGDRQDANILEFFTRQYNQSAGCDPWPMKGTVSLDGKYVSENSYDDDEDLEPYFLINTDDGVGYIYPYAFVALPKKSGGHHIVRMD